MPVINFCSTCWFNFFSGPKTSHSQTVISNLQDSNDAKLTCQTTSQLLMLLYALSYQDYLLANMATLGKNVLNFFVNIAQN